MRGPGRREVGHGYFLAALSAFVNICFPTKARIFPHTIRIVADMLESDGSTSNGNCMWFDHGAYMQAGVPIKKMVSGIAMGLLKNKATGEFPSTYLIFPDLKMLLDLWILKSLVLRMVLLPSKWISNIKVAFRVTFLKAALESKP